jgi:hypothetical protein
VGHSRGPEAGDIPKYILEALKRAYPDGLIEMPITDEEASFWEIHPKLKQGLSRLKGVSLIYERKPEGGPLWNEGFDPDEDPPDWSENSRSYHLFFLSPDDPKFTYETEEEQPEQKVFGREEPDEEGSAEEGLTETLAGTGRVGCSVAISLVAPFALITPDHMETFEGGSFTEPNLGPQAFTMEGEPVEASDYIRDFVGQKGLRVLQDLSRKIASLLQAHQITVLSKEDLRKPVAWLVVS